MMIKVLLIEDNPVDAQLTKDILAEESADQFDLSQVDQMSEAIRRLRNERFDVVLLDLSLPDANGLETVHQIQVTTPS
ncbi:MAG: response regulator [Nitrospirae bacterium]|nr:MAG: response regulator [Nitrospirota bacterium]